MHHSQQALKNRVTEAKNQGFAVCTQSIRRSTPLNTVSTYRTHDIKFTESWNKLPQKTSTFLSHQIDAKVESGTSGGAVFAEELRDKPQITGLAQNPLLLSLLCSLYQEKGLMLPARLTQVYAKAVDYMLSKWGSDNNRQSSSDGWVIAKIELLESLAYQFSCEGKEIFSLRELRDKIEKFLRGESCSDFRNATAADLIEELCKGASQMCKFIVMLFA